MRMRMSSDLSCSLLILLILPLYNFAGKCPRECTCESTTVSCTDPQLNIIPHFLDPGILHFDLSGTSIIRLDHGLDFYSNLLELNISYSKIQSLGDNQFVRLNKLRRLKAERSRIVGLKPGAFLGLQSLESLNLRGNLITKLHAGVFSGLEKLVFLDLSSNNIREIEEESFKNLPSLQHIILSKNSLQEFGGWFPPSTKILNLSQNQISRVSNSTVTPISIQDLDLSDNLISVVEPRSFYWSPALARLDLSYNKLGSIPNILANSLEEVVLSGNMIRKIEPEDMDPYISLKMLHLNNLPVLSTILPSAFNNLNHLKFLTLASNRKLAAVPNLAGLDNLEVLDISLLHLETLTSDQVLGPSLKTLRLGETELTCSCSLSWLRTLAITKPGLVERAKCDGVEILEVPEEKFKCSHTDIIIAIAVIGSLFFIILIVIITIIILCSKRRDPQQKRDYLQYPPGDTLTSQSLHSTSSSSPYYCYAEYTLPSRSLPREYTVQNGAVMPTFEDHQLGTGSLSSLSGHPSRALHRPAERKRTSAGINCFKDSDKVRGNVGKPSSREHRFSQYMLADPSQPTWYTTPGGRIPASNPRGTDIICLSESEYENSEDSRYFSLTVNPLDRCPEQFGRLNTEDARTEALNKEDHSSGYNGSNSLQTNSSPSSGSSTQLRPLPGQTQLLRLPTAEQLESSRGGSHQLLRLPSEQLVSSGGMQLQPSYRYRPPNCELCIKEPMFATNHTRARNDRIPDLVKISNNI